MSLVDDYRAMQAAAQEDARKKLTQAQVEQYLSSSFDPVNAPAHYRTGDIECIDAIESALTAEEFRGHCKANALKYIWRERHKGQDESLKKAIWYLERAVKA